MRLFRAVTCILGLITMWCGTTGAAFARDWPEKPRLEEFREYTDFMKAQAAYRQFLRQTAVQTPLMVTAPDMPSTMTELTSNAPEMLDPLSESYPPPLIVSGPEDLDDAVEKAKGFIHPVYTAKRRYNRSTSQSFPLLPAGSDLLAGAEIATVFFGSQDSQGLIQMLLEQDDVLSSQRAGDQGERLLEEVGQALPHYPEAFVLPSTWNHGVPQGVVEIYHR